MLFVRKLTKGKICSYKNKKNGNYSAHTKIKGKPDEIKGTVYVHLPFITVYCTF